MAGGQVVLTSFRRNGDFPQIWEVQVEYNGKPVGGLFHAHGELWLNDGSDPAPDWVPRGRKNPGPHYHHSHKKVATYKYPKEETYQELIDPQLWRLADGGDTYAMYELELRGPGHQLPARPNPARKNWSQRRLPSRGSGRAGGYTKRERARLPDRDFLKPKTRSWPVGDPRHFQIALQYMVAGRGNSSEYPMLIHRLAELWPVSSHSSLWSIYSRNRKKIERKYGGSMPTLKSLRRRG